MGKILKSCLVCFILVAVFGMLVGCGSSKKSSSNAPKAENQIEEHTKESSAANQASEYVFDVDGLGKFKGTISSNVGFAVCGVIERDVLSVERPQGRFVIVNIALFNGTKKAITMRETDYKLVSIDGIEYSYSVRAIKYAPGGQTGGDYKEINPGFSVSRVLPFDVPKNVKISDLRLKAVFGRNGTPVLLPLVVQKVG